MLVIRLKMLFNRFLKKSLIYDIILLSKLKGADNMWFIEWLAKTWFVFAIVLPAIIGIFWVCMTPLLMLLKFLWEHKFWVFLVILILCWIF